MNWQLLSKKNPDDQEQLKEILLENREISDQKVFFNPAHPLDLTLESVGIDQTQSKKAVSKIKEAVKKEKDIVIFGDYDADGICASTVLWRALTKFGAKVRPFIPHRQKHGYGLSESALNDIIEDQKPDLIITVDNGIVAHQAVEFAISHGIEIIVTDHHQVEDKLPKATAIFHTDKLCGTTVAWMLARELLGKNLPELLDLCAVATIADQVELKDANRSFAWHGLEDLKETKNPGLKAIIETANLSKRPLDSYSVGYGIAPRINAMGRLEDGMQALRLLCTDSSSTARKLAQNLSQVNIKRQDLTQVQLEDAITQARAQSEQKLIVVSSTEYHEGVMGLIAGRLTEMFARPSIVVSISEEQAKGSARSVPGVNIIQLIRQVKNELLSAGGHPMAAGFSVELTKFENVTMMLQEIAMQDIDPQSLIKTLDLECELKNDLINEDTIKTIESFAPFGSGNPKPIFSLNNLKINSFQQMGSENTHLKIICDGFELVAFRKGELATQLKTGQQFDAAGSLELNVWRDRRTIQVIVRDLQLH